MEAIWKEVKAKIKECIPGHSYRMWIEPIEFLENRESDIILSCPNFFSKKRVQDHYSIMIESELDKVSGKKCNLRIEIFKKKTDAEDHSFQMSPQLVLPAPNFQPFGGHMLRTDFTFENFVVSGNNNFAYSAALSLASQKNSNQNSLFLLSKTGMGKSHLSQAVGHRILSERPAERVYYITAEDFTNEMVHAIRNDYIDQFKEKYRNQCDTLLLEDVHFLTGKERTQNELVSTIDCLYEANKKIIFSSCCQPADIPKLNEKLRSRLACSLISSIDPPNFHARVKILKKKSKEKRYVLPDDVIEYLAQELSENVRQLESGLVSVAAKSSLLGEPIDLRLAQSVVKHIARQHKNITIDVIKKLVCAEYRITVNDIVSHSRKQSVVRPRQIAIYLSRRYTDQTLQAIGKSFNRYHATALHSIGTVERELKENGAVQKQVEFFCRKLESGKF
jgi:chromosomal replication initiator protein